MNYVRLGSSGLMVTELTLGSNYTMGGGKADKQSVNKLIDKAWELGIRSFDTANAYGYGKAERLIGDALKKYPREEYVISTKVYWPMEDEKTPYNSGLSRKHIFNQINESLNRLGLEYVDIYYAHRYDEEIEIKEIVKSFNILIEQGMVRYWGISEWPLYAIEECVSICEKYGYEKPIVNQCACSYVEQKIMDNGIAEFCKKNGIGIMGFYPLSQGILTGKYREEIPENSRLSEVDDVERKKILHFAGMHDKKINNFFDICDEYNIGYVAVAFQWCIKNGFWPVMGARTSEQLEIAVKGIELEIPEEVWIRLMN